MKKLFFVAALSTLVISCNKKTETTKIETPKVKTKSAEEIIGDMYTDVNGFDCELKMADSDKVTKVFYNKSATDDEASSSPDLALTFSAIKPESDELGSGMVIDTFFIWRTKFKEESDSNEHFTYYSIPKYDFETEEGFNNQTTIQLDYDSRSLTFEVSKLFTKTSKDGLIIIEEKADKIGSISNCIESSHKVIKGLE